MEEIGRFSTASLITRSTNDVTQVQMLIVMGLSIMLRAPIMAVMAILKIVDKSWAVDTLHGRCGCCIIDCRYYLRQLMYAEVQTLTESDG